MTTVLAVVRCNHGGAVGWLGGSTLWDARTRMKALPPKDESVLEKSDYVLVMATDVVNNSTHDVTVLKVELVQGNKQLAMVRYFACRPAIPKAFQRSAGLPSTGGLRHIEPIHVEGEVSGGKRFAA